ncbi:hypothetical protein AVEN_189095-1 [Araneus ventricosus]|uniref:Uncharacterized protein n=2 Tax=Araneus ventricosus TaxID=182803 RepID=A0A4Y2HG42_ARAVE|nr:hypothetical protein AVEN_189095-1 [Araneus ventricosus]
MEITMDQQDDNHEVQRTTDCPVQVPQCNREFTENFSRFAENLDSKKSLYSENSHSGMKGSIFQMSDAKDGLQVYDLIKKHVDFEEFEKEPTAENSKVSKALSELYRQYCDYFSAVSQKIEKWASHRRMLLKAAESATSSLTKIKLYASKSKMTLSAIDVIGTSASLILDRFDKNWATTLLYTSAGFGCLSFIGSMFDITKTSFIMEDILKQLRKDAEYLEDIQDSLQKMYSFDRNVQKLFPHGIDARVVKLIQEPYTARRTKPENYKGVISALSETSERVQIFLAVLISNLRADPTLLEDKEFMANVRAFAKSRIAEKWWNRMKHQGMLPILHKSKLFTYLNSLSRIESMPIRTFPLLSSPVWHLNGFPTVGAIFMNSMVVFDAYCDLIQNGKTRETDLLQELKQTLEVEYKKIMDVYQQLNPYADE